MEKWLAGGLAVISLLLPLSRLWFNKQAVLRQRWFVSLAKFLYFVGLPYAALLFGVLTPQRLGLKGLEYFSLLSNTSLFFDLQRVFTLMLVEWLVDAGPVLGMGLVAGLILGGVILLLARSGITGTFAPGTGLDTFYTTLHWAFYWALFWLIVDDAYLGLLLGSGWVVLERFLSARLQKTRFGGQPSDLIEMMILILAASIFFYRPNLWLLWPVHLALVVSTGMLQAKIAIPQKSPELFE
jgi:hypothetical protein